MSWGGAASPETNVVVSVVRVVVVAVRGATVLAVVVPAAAAQHPVLALWTDVPKSLNRVDPYISVTNRSNGLK